MFRTYLRSLGIHATPHQFRHYFASEVYDVTRDLRLTQELLGHASPHTTAIYTKVRPSHDAVAVVRSLGGASQ
jgi:site-specific recombinase XerC